MANLLLKFFCYYIFTFFQSSLSQCFVTQRRPGRLKLFYKQEPGRGHAVGVGSISRRPHRVLLHSSWRPSHSALFDPDEGSVPRGWAAISFCQLSQGFLCSAWAATEQQRCAGPEPPVSTFWVSAWTQSRNFSRVCSQGLSWEPGWLCPAVSLPACL